MAALTANIVSNLKPGGEFTKRDIEAAGGAQRFMENRFGGEDALGDAVARPHSLKFMRENKIPINRATLDTIMGLTSEDLKNNSEKFRTVFGDDPEMAKKAQNFAKERESIQATSDPVAAKLMRELEERKRSGVPLSAKEEEAYSSALGATFLSKQGGKEAIKAATPEAITALGRGFMQRQYGPEVTGITPDTPEVSAKKLEAAKNSMAEQRAKDAYATQEGINFSGEKAKEADMARLINPKTVSDMAKVSEEANKKISTAGEISDPSKAADMAISSMESFSTALDTLSAKINNMASANVIRPGAPLRSATPKTQ